jgi:hypothetical protein
MARTADFSFRAFHTGDRRVATWSKMRLRFPSSSLPWCHYLSEADYRLVLDPTDYTEPVPPPIVGEEAASGELIVVT